MRSAWLCFMPFKAVSVAMLPLFPYQNTMDIPKKKNLDHDLNLFKESPNFSLNKNYSNSVFKLVLWIKIECIS